MNSHWHWRRKYAGMSHKQLKHHGIWEIGWSRLQISKICWPPVCLMKYCSGSVAWTGPLPEKSSKLKIFIAYGARYCHLPLITASALWPLTLQKITAVALMILKQYDKSWLGWFVIVSNKNIHNHWVTLMADWIRYSSISCLKEWKRVLKRQDTTQFARIR